MVTMDPRDILAQRAAQAPAPGVSRGSSSYFTTPTSGLDPNLFEGDRMLPGVREWIDTTGYAFLNSRYNGARTWATIWVAGSGVTYQWSAARSPGDLDVLIGVNTYTFKRHNQQFKGASDTEIAHHVTQTLRELGEKTARTHIGPGGIWCEGSVGTAGSTPPLLAGGAPTVSRDTTATGISSGSTGSTSSATSGSWLDRRDAALSARAQNRAGHTTSSRSTTAMTPGGYAASSASSATPHSASLGIPSKESSRYSSTSEAVYEVTFYVNPGAADIRDINPYAAYDVTHNRWTVTPPDLPEDWGTQYFPQDWWKTIGDEKRHAQSIITDYLGHRQQYLQAPDGGYRVNAASALEYDVVLAKTLFDDIHESRRQAFSPNGRGYNDWYNFRWQAHKRNGVIPALHALADLKKQADDQSFDALYGHPLASSEEALSTASLLHAHLGSLAVR